MKNIVAAIQINSVNKVDKNLKKIEKFIKLAKKQGAKLVVLPENFAFMPSSTQNIKDIAETLNDGKIQTRISNIAKKLDIWIIAGSTPTIQDNKVYQTLIAFDNHGKPVDYYNKVHLFDVVLPNKKESYKESDDFAAGTQYKVIDTPVGRIGLTVCYDLRFPEQFRALLKMGAEVFVVPAAFTYTTGKSHWKTLLKARAVENLSYVVAAAQTGQHINGRKTWGHSIILNPWGKTKSLIRTEEGIILSEINIKKMKQKRELFPTINHIVDIE